MLNLEPFSEKIEEIFAKEMIEDKIYFDRILLCSMLIRYSLNNKFFSIVFDNKK
jgi:hypothetical protein